MKYKKNVFQSFTMVMQFGINMIVPILMCTLFGVYDYCGASFYYGCTGGIQQYLSNGKEDF